MFRTSSAIVLAITIASCTTSTDTTMNLQFFNQLSGRLEIELTEPTEQIAPNLMNQRAKPTAQIKSLKLTAEVYEHETFRPLTAAEYERVVFSEPVVRLKGEGGPPIEHKAPNGKHFTVRDLLGAVEETERQTRGRTDWFDGIDVHHVYFEGLHPEGEGVWSIRWGS